MNIEAFKKLIEHYEANAPEHWGYTHCATGAIVKLDMHQSGDFDTFLGLDNLNYRRLIYATNDPDRIRMHGRLEYVHAGQTPETNQQNVLGMLRRAVASGDGHIEWKHETRNVA